MATSTFVGSAITVDGISKRFRLYRERPTSLKERIVRFRMHADELWALRDVSFDVPSGQTLGLIGPNGSGKTTLFECMGGVLPLDEGSLVRSGRPIGNRERASTLFYLPDQIVPWPAQSVRLRFSPSKSTSIAAKCRWM